MNAVDLCKRFEGLYLKPYLCPAGVPTIGYGSTYYEDGTRVKLTDPAITKERAEALLMYTLKTVYIPQVKALCPGVTGDKSEALTDINYNIGAANLKQSTLRRKVNAGDFEGAALEFAKWNKAGGKVLRGLTLRRELERQLFLSIV